MVKCTYVATFERVDDGNFKGFISAVPDLNVFSQGEDLLTAIEKTRGGMKLVLSYLTGNNYPIPEPRTQMSDIPKESGIYTQWVTVDY
jgi:predicted RNase H-like HicB family nuclease